MKKFLKNKILSLSFCLLFFVTFSSSAFAKVDIGNEFGYGHITSLGQATSFLVTPMFSLAAFVVTWYFLWGAWDWLVSEGDKQRVADARNKMTQAIVGFIILIIVFFLLPFILYQLLGVDLRIIKI